MNKRIKLFCKLITLGFKGTLIIKSLSLTVRVKLCGGLSIVLEDTCKHNQPQEKITVFYIFVCSGEPSCLLWSTAVPYVKTLKTHIHGCEECFHVWLLLNILLENIVTHLHILLQWCFTQWDRLRLDFPQMILYSINYMSAEIRPVLLYSD